MTSQDGRGGPRIEPRFDSPDADGAAQRPAADGEQESRPGLRGKVLGICIAVVALGGFAGVAWYATLQGQKDTSTIVPVIRADPSPIKVRPEKPGGLDVPNRDKLVFMQTTPEQQTPRVERLLPPPEKPLAKPAPPPAEATAAAPPSGPLMPEVPVIMPRPGGGAPAQKPAPVSTPSSLPVKPKAQARAAIPKDEASKKMAPRGAFQVQLGAMKSKTRAAREAARIARVYKSLLGGLKVSAMRVDLGKRGIYYRLRAGPFENRAAADALCRKIAARKTGCIVIKP